MVGKVMKGQLVEVSTGEVHVEPGILMVVRPPLPQSGFHVGDSLYVLTNQGEGYLSVWREGTLSSLNPQQDICPGVEHMERASCFGWAKHPAEDWWAKISLPHGKSGWARVEGQLRARDACGGD